MGVTRPMQIGANAQLARSDMGGMPDCTNDEQADLFFAAIELATLDEAGIAWLADHMVTCESCRWLCIYYATLAEDLLTKS